MLKRGSILDSGLHFVEEWDYSKNETFPSDYTIGSGRKVWWLCSICGHSWKSRIDHRAKGVGCPQCAKELQSSFPEQAVYFYIKKCFSDAINGDRKIIKPYELDVYIPSVRVAIEYDGQAFHVKEAKDQKKNQLCREKCIRLYRIRELGDFN